MKKLRKAIISLLLVLAMLVSCVVTASAAAKNSKTMYVGVGKADITGPVTRISTGYNSLGDLMEGLLMHMYARAYIVKVGDKSICYVSAEMVHMTESIKPGVLKELKKRGLSQYGEENTMLTATHCHDSTSNVSYYGLYDLVNGVPGFDKDSYNYIVNGICDAIEKADKDLAPGSMSAAYGKTNIHSYNRSLDAAKWDVNYDASKFKNDLDAVENSVDKEMSVISFRHDKGGPCGMIAFFPSHGTSNSIDNRLVGADHKGYAAYKVEQEMGNGYVAAFPQNESGDASPNSPQPQDYHAAFQRPSDKDKSLDPIENEVVAGQEEADWALKILKGGPGITTIKKLSPVIAYNYTTVDFSNVKVDKKYIGKYHMPYDDVDHAKTSEPCIGAAMIAGDEEGAPVDNAKEGTVRNDYKLDKDGKVVRTPVDFDVIDLYGLQKLFKTDLWPIAMHMLRASDYDDEQMEKVVCLAPANLGLMQRTQPFQLFRIGEIAIAGAGFEVNSEQGRRTREVLTNTLKKAGVKKVIFATHANSYSQYITTREEYAAQHYEGASCLYGPWSGAAMTQILDGLAQDMVAGRKSPKGPDMATEIAKLNVSTPAALKDPDPDIGNPGTLKEDVKSTYKIGDTVTAHFEGANPRHITILRNSRRKDLAPDNYSYMYVQVKKDGKWVTLLTDEDPYTYIHFSGTWPNNYTDASVNWLTKKADPGEYRLVYHVISKTGNDSYKVMNAVSSPFTLTK